MILEALSRTELIQYFQIKTDLAAAVRSAAAVDIEFHLGELAVMRLHTNSDRLRRACAATLASYAQEPAAAIVG
jgi:hypothetical protein